MLARSVTGLAAAAAVALLLSGCGNHDDGAFVPDECLSDADLSGATGMTFSVHEGADPPFEGRNKIGRYCDFAYAAPDTDPAYLRIEYYAGAVDDEIFAEHVANTEVYRGTCEPVDLPGAQACALDIGTEGGVRLMIFTQRSLVEMPVNGGGSSLEVGTAVARLVIDQFPQE